MNTKNLQIAVMCEIFVGVAIALQFGDIIAAGMAMLSWSFYAIGSMWMEAHPRIDQIDRETFRILVLAATEGIK